MSGASGPNLVVIGAMRGGTTSLHELLGRHPEIFMSRIKGPGLFLDPEETVAYPSKYRSTAEKRRFLSDAALLDAMREGWRNERIFGESTDLYARHPVAGRGAPEKMLRSNAEMRIVYIVRDPIERILSQLRFERRKPHRPASACLASYLASSADPIGASRYHTQLQRFLRSGFTAEQIHVLALEELLEDTRGALRGLADFLRVAPWPAETLRQLPHRNATEGAAPAEIGAEARAHLVRELEPDVRALEAWLGRRLPFRSWPGPAPQQTAAYTSSVRAASLSHP